MEAELDRYMYDHNNSRYSQFVLERTWSTKFWPGRKFAWFLAVTEANTSLADGYFWRGGNVVPTFQFRSYISK